MTKNKLFQLSSLSLLILALTVSSVQARMENELGNEKSARIQVETQPKAGRQENSTKTQTQSTTEEKKITNRKMSLGKEIDARLGTLNRLVNLIFNSKKLTQEQKDQLTSEVQSLITQTEALKVSIQNETDLVKLKAFQTQIKTLNQSFNFLYPKISLITYADKLLEIAEILRAKTTDQIVIGKINQLVTDTNSAIKEIMALTATSTNSRTQLADYKKKLVNLRLVVNQIRNSINKSATATPTSAQ